MRPIRFIRDWLYGNSISANDNWVEVQALNLSAVNLAFGCAVSSSLSGSGNQSVLTNGSTVSTEQFYITGPLPPQWIMVDLGSIRTDIAIISVWHYYTDSRTYHGTKTEVSPDGVTWFTLFNSASSGEYPETATGHTVPVTYSGFALVCGASYFEPSLNPVPAQATPAHYHAATVTAGGVAYHFPDSLVETLVTYTWPALPELDRAALDTFFLGSAVGTVNPILVYDPYLAVLNNHDAYPGEFASPEYACSEVSAGIFEISFQVRLIIV